jgi:hypothetical protein
VGIHADDYDDTQLAVATDRVYGLLTHPTAPALPAALAMAEATGASGAAVTYSASATDAVDGARPVSCAPGSGTTFPIGVTTVSCSSTDTAGNTSTGSFTVTVSDTTGPVLSLPASQTVEATSPAGATATFAATATDAVDGARPVTCAPASGATFPLGTTNVACSATDTRGNASNGGFSVTVRDTTAPSLSLPAGASAEATSAAGAAVTYAASATDAADATVPVVCDHASGGTFPLGATLVTCTATDDSGNAAGGTFTVHVGDTTEPAVNVPAVPVTVEATGVTGAPATYTVSAYDSVDGALTPSCTPASGGTFPVGTTPVACTATDAAGNTGHGAFDVTVVDTTPPALTLPGDLGAEATSPAGAAVTFDVSALDLVDGGVPVDCDHAPGTFPLGVTTVACTATDAHGNVSSGSFTVTVVDTTDPVLSLPGDLVREATSAAGAGVVYAASASDTVSGALPATCLPVAGSVFPIGTTTVTCTAVDAAGNDTEGTFDVTVADTTPPAIHVPGGTVEEATGPGGAAVTYVVTADDAVDATVTIACTPASGATFPLGSTHVSCTATDDAGNATPGGFDVVVQDTLAPAIGVPDDLSAEATGPGGAAVAYTATATDAVTNVTPSCSTASGATFPLGATLVTCSATDAAGNTGSGSFTVTVVDTTPPALVMPADRTVEATGPGGASSTYAATATDLVDGARTPSCTPPSGTTFTIGAHEVSCSVTDAAGNEAHGTFTVTVVDTTPPVLALPDNVVEEAAGASGNAVTYAATATDTVDGTVPVNCTPASGATFPLGTTPVTCSATDAHGNPANGGFTVTVSDTSAPAITVPHNATVEATGPGGATHTYTATAHDTVDGDLTPGCTPASGATFPLGVNAVACSATDAHGNLGTGGFTVTVVDTTPPTVSVPADKTVEATGPGGAAVTYAASASDAVSGALPPSCGPVSGATFPLGTTTVTCTATDGAGNIGSGSFHVTVADTTAPALSLPAGRTAEATSAAGATVTYAASASDAVSGALAPDCNPASGATFALGTTTVVCSVTDGAGNLASGSFPVLVQDTTRPALTVPASFGVTASDPTGAVVTYATSATDAVTPSVPVSCTPASGAAFAMGATVVGCSATDGAGNTTSKSFTVSVGFVFGGFLQPVNDTNPQTGVLQSRFKLGSTVPLKFQLGTLGSASVQQAGSPAFAKAFRGACDSATSTEVAPDTTSTSGTIYRWDASGAQYVYNFSTKGLAAGEWRVWALTADGGQHWVDLCLTR